uniref:Uncharacterized protein n=1 Tax=Haptolina brevifila TaxID=156173 RepID=A0A7S2H135_9EUKA
MNGLSSVSRPSADPSDADAAFARMAAAYPNATIIGEPAAQSEADAAADTTVADEAFARIVAANPGATVIRGPAGGARATADERPAAPNISTWRFSEDLSAERRAEIMAMVGATPTAAEEEAEAAAADSAFQRMVDAAGPGVTEVAPGVFSVDHNVEAPTGELR